jgi:hypothetical protein
MEIKETGMVHYDIEFEVHSDVFSSGKFGIEAVSKKSLVEVKKMGRKHNRKGSVRSKVGIPSECNSPPYLRIDVRKVH